MSKEQIVKNMNEDLSRKLGSIVQYINYATKATGPYSSQLRALGADESGDKGNLLCNCKIWFGTRGGMQWKPNEC